MSSQSDPGATSALTAPTPLAEKRQCHFSAVSSRWSGKGCVGCVGVFSNRESGGSRARLAGWVDVESWRSVVSKEVGYELWKPVGKGHQDDTDGFESDELAVREEAKRCPKNRIWRWTSSYPLTGITINWMAEYIAEWPEDSGGMKYGRDSNDR
ncbi:hypothetical protein P152DRAFT_447714 [Eremomyces bilateralis CBS 781.70]|uniref:Uncharacterized protein n=1 Tax=Eremomyces bilateralis CBS 781.70 TaxID=1392243 RepID=A0A6G1G8S9_9PEZI|nr:uncharacterized protein P152DRAFT_447714 [Eremomyces bilateralis CBS 781.70]KAF1814336.1 hypothetical protein P152DRAFT_447714 [Eremomyces bilateralis CBS 781.70]